MVASVSGSDETDGAAVEVSVVVGADLVPVVVVVVVNEKTL